MIIIGSDHTGIKLKEEIINYFKKDNIIVLDVNQNILEDSIDYPDIAKLIGTEVNKNKENLGIAICGTGIGISIACNKIKGIRAALCVDEYMSSMARKHNNANILCIGARNKSSENIENVFKILDGFFNNEFEGGRHQERLKKINSIENEKIGDNKNDC